MGKEKERCAGVTVKGESTHAMVNTTAMYVSGSFWLTITTLSTSNGKITSL